MNPEVIFIFFSLFFFTYILEDPAVYLALVLIAEGKISEAAGLTAVATGIFTGDVLLYLLGRYGHRVSFLEKYVFNLLNRAGELQWFRGLTESLQRNSVLFIVFSRFMPGFRLPVYFLSGRNNVSMVMFAAVTLVMAFIWVWSLAAGFHISIAFLSDNTGWGKVAVYLTLLAGFVLLLRIASFFSRPCSFRVLWNRILSLRHWEFWPPWLFYLPLVFYISWLMIRYRLFITSLSMADPAFDAGGLSFDSKFSMMNRFSGSKIAKTILLDRGEEISTYAGSLPIIAKPDKGHRGFGVRLVKNSEELERYRKTAADKYLLQEYVDYPLEYGVFWQKFPWEKKGKVVSVTRKIFPFVTGNGKDRFADLVLADSRARYLAGYYLAVNLNRIHDIPQKGETVVLTKTGNHACGTIFEDGAGDIKGKTLAALEALCDKVEGFYFGRLDVRFRDKKSLSDGTGFKVLEVNGAEAEMTHIYDRRYSIGYAWGVLFRQWRDLFAIAAWNISESGKRPGIISGLYQYGRFFLLGK